VDFVICFLCVPYGPHGPLPTNIIMGMGPRTWGWGLVLVVRRQEALSAIHAKI